MLYAKTDLIAFGIFFFIFLFAFSCVNTLVLGPEVYDYSDLVRTMETLLVRSYYWITWSIFDITKVLLQQNTLVI